jgi:hypothetical protein
MNSFQKYRDFVVGGFDQIAGGDRLTGLGTGIDGDERIGDILTVLGQNPVPMHGFDLTQNRVSSLDDDKAKVLTVQYYSNKFSNIADSKDIHPAFTDAIMDVARIFAKIDKFSEAGTRKQQLLQSLNYYLKASFIGEKAASVEPLITGFAPSKIHTETHQFYRHDLSIPYYLTIGADNDLIDINEFIKAPFGVKYVSLYHRLLIIALIIFSDTYTSGDLGNAINAVLANAKFETHLTNVTNLIMNGVGLIHSNMNLPIDDLEKYPKSMSSIIDALEKEYEAIMGYPANPSPYDQIGDVLGVAFRKVLQEDLLNILNNSNITNAITTYATYFDPNTGDARPTTIANHTLAIATPGSVDRVAVLHDITTGTNFGFGGSPISINSFIKTSAAAEADSLTNIQDRHVFLLGVEALTQLKQHISNIAGFATGGYNPYRIGGVVPTTNIGAIQNAQEEGGLPLEWVGIDTYAAQLCSADKTRGSLIALLHTKVLDLVSNIRNDTNTVFMNKMLTRYTIKLLFEQLLSANSHFGTNASGNFAAANFSADKYAHFYKTLLIVNSFKDTVAQRLRFSDGHYQEAITKLSNEMKNKFNSTAIETIFKTRNDTQYNDTTLNNDVVKTYIKRQLQCGETGKAFLEKNFTIMVRSNVLTGGSRKGFMGLYKQSGGAANLWVKTNIDFETLLKVDRPENYRLSINYTLINNKRVPSFAAQLPAYNPKIMGKVWYTSKNGNYDAATPAHAKNISMYLFTDLFTDLFNKLSVGSLGNNVLNVGGAIFSVRDVPVDMAWMNTKPTLFFLPLKKSDVIKNYLKTLRFDNGAQITDDIPKMLQDYADMIKTDLWSLENIKENGSGGLDYIYHNSATGENHNFYDKSNEEMCRSSILRFNPQDAVECSNFLSQCMMKDDTKGVDDCLSFIGRSKLYEPKFAKEDIEKLDPHIAFVILRRFGFDYVDKESEKYGPTRVVESVSEWYSRMKVQVENPNNAYGLTKDILAKMKKNENLLRYFHLLSQFINSNKRLLNKGIVPRNAQASTALLLSELKTEDVRIRPRVETKEGPQNLIARLITLNKAPVHNAFRTTDALNSLVPMPVPMNMFPVAAGLTTQFIPRSIMGMNMYGGSRTVAEEYVDSLNTNATTLEAYFKTLVNQLRLIKKDLSEPTKNRIQEKIRRFAEIEEEIKREVVVITDILNLITQFRIPIDVNNSDFDELKRLREKHISYLKRGTKEFENLRNVLVSIAEIFQKPEIMKQFEKVVKFTGNRLSNEVDRKNVRGPLGYEAFPL